MFKADNENFQLLVFEKNSKVCNIMWRGSTVVQNTQPNKYLLGQFAAFAVGQCSMRERYKPYQRLRNRTVRKIKF